MAFAALVWWLAPLVASRDGGANDAHAPRDAAEAWHQTGVAVIAIPLLWVLATWVVGAVRFTLLGSWSTDGLVFLSFSYYRGLFMDYAPWLMAGFTVLGVRRHL